MSFQGFLAAINTGLKTVVLFIPLQSLNKEYSVIKSSWEIEYNTTDNTTFLEVLLTLKNSSNLPFTQQIDYPMYGCFECGEMQYLSYNINNK